MRVFYTILFVFAFSQVNSQNIKTELTLSFENTKIIDVLNQIENATDIKFFYIEDWIKDIYVSGNYNKASIDTILKDIFKNTVINYYLLNGTNIILTKNNAIHDAIPETDTEIINDVYEEAPSKPVFFNETQENVQEKEEETIKIGKEEATPIQTKYTISGFVKDKNNGNPLANIAIVVRGKGIGTTTDANGFYQLKLSSGSYVLINNSLNTKSIRKKIAVFNDGEVNFYLEEKVESLPEVIVKANPDKNVKEVITGAIKIDVEGVKNIPLVLGERDILRVATTLPGIATTGEGSSGYNVRGGKTDQNLILLDNASIYNPTHLFGIFSAINPFTTGEVEIYKGNIPAEYGGRLSSVFNITTKDANTEKLTGEASIGFVTSNLSLEIPIVKDKAAIMVGGRSTYSNWILRTLDEESLKDSEASFYDVILKYNHKIDDKNNIKSTAYYSKDRFSITSDSLYGYSNRLFSIGWNHKFNDKHQGSLALSNSEYQFNIEYDGDFSNDFDLNYKNNETEAKFKFNYKYNDDITFIYGLSSKLYKIFPGNVSPLNNESLIEPIDIQEERGLESALFASAQIKLDEKLSLSAGLRYSFYAYLGAATQRIYEDNLPLSEATLIATETFGKNEVVETFNGFEARFSARYFLAEDFSVKASYNNSNQYIHTLTTNTTVSPTDTWKLSDKNIKPQESQQISLGFFHNFDDNNYEVSLESYYKTYSNILDYKVGAQLLLNETLETEVLQGKGKSYGIEFLIRKNGGRWNGWLGYTYSRTFIKLDSQFAEERINNGEYFPANFDKPHDFSAVLNYKMTQRFSFSANFAYQTGRPITYPTGTFVFNNAEFTLYSDRNKFRIPDYYRLDIGFNYEANHKINKLVHSFWNLSIYNVLGRNNPYSVFFVTEDGQIKAYQSSIFSIPIPTISFNFKF